MKNLNLKQHPLYKDYYGTEDGGVYSKKFKSGRIKQLNPMRLNTGYYLLGLCYQKQRIQILHHKFIADIFVSNPNNYTEINHKDEDKSNNCSSNLEWCDRCYNMQYSKHKLVDCNAKWYVIENRKTGEIFKIFNLKQWCKENNVDRISAHKVVNGKWRHTKNFIIKKLDTAN